MKIFAEAFQSCFKDGLDGTIDFRMIPSAIVLISVLFLGNDSVFSMGPHGFCVFFLSRNLLPSTL